MSVKSLNAILRFSKLSRVHRRRWRSLCGRSIKTPVASSRCVMSESGRRGCSELTLERATGKEEEREKARLDGVSDHAGAEGRRR